MKLVSIAHGRNSNGGGWFISSACIVRVCMWPFWLQERARTGHCSCARKNGLLEVLSVTYDFIGELTIYLLWRLPRVSPAVVLVVRLTSAYWTGDAWLA